MLAPRRGWAGITQLAVSTLDQGPLQSRGLVEGEPIPCRRAVLDALGEMDRTKRLVLRTQIPFPYDVIRQRILDRIEYVEDLAHTRVHVPALHLRVRWVDREEV